MRKSLQSACAAAILFTLSGCKDNVPQILTDARAVVEEYTDIMARVEDNESAKYAVDGPFKKLKDRYESINKRVQRWCKYDAEDDIKKPEKIEEIRTALNAFKKDIAANSKRLLRENLRLEAIIRNADADEDTSGIRELLDSVKDVFSKELPSIAVVQKLAELTADKQQNQGGGFNPGGGVGAPPGGGGPGVGAPPGGGGPGVGAPPGGGMP